MKALAKIAKVKSKFKDKILKEIIKVEKYKYYNKGKLSPEYKNMSISHAIDILSEFRDYIKDKKEFIDFIKEATKSSRPTFKKRAETLLKKFEK